LQALKVLDDDMQCDIIKIGNIIRNKVSLSLNPRPLQDN
jgi:rRNA processing protein Krr1/Pno1